VVASNSRRLAGDALVLVGAEPPQQPRPPLRKEVRWSRDDQRLASTPPTEEACAITHKGSRESAKSPSL
jgi:hypothetical protein